MIREKAPEAELYAVKIFDRKLAATIDKLVAGLRWAIEQRMDLVNLSLGTANPNHTAILTEVVGEAVAAGTRIVAAYEDAGTRWLPGSLPGVVPVLPDFRIDRDSMEPCTLESGDGLSRVGLSKADAGRVGGAELKRHQLRRGECDRYSCAVITMFRILALLPIAVSTAAAAISPSHIHMESLFASSDLVAVGRCTTVDLRNPGQPFEKDGRLVPLDYVARYTALRVYKGASPIAQIEVLFPQRDPAWGPPSCSANSMLVFLQAEHEGSYTLADPNLGIEYFPEDGSTPATSLWVPNYHRTPS